MPSGSVRSCRNKILPCSNVAELWWGLVGFLEGFVHPLMATDGDCNCVRRCASQGGILLPALQQWREPTAGMEWKPNRVKELPECLRELMRALSSTCPDTASRNALECSLACNDKIGGQRLRLRCGGGAVKGRGLGSSSPQSRRTGSVLSSNQDQFCLPILTKDFFRIYPTNKPTSRCLPIFSQSVREACCAIVVAAGFPHDQLNSANIMTWR